MMNRNSFTLVAALILTACDGSGSSSTAVVNQPDAANNTTNNVSTTTPSNSLIEGTITLFNDLPSASNINISVRGTTISSTMQTNGAFELTLPEADTARTVTLDISGSNVLPNSVPVQIPANAEMVSVSANVSGRTPAITFNLETGGSLQNPESPNRTSVSVPANAFQFSDGTIATGDAQVSITEIDIQDLHGESAWAPNLVGIAEGMNEPSAIWTFGMSDFHFSQNGQELQLRPGVDASIKMDLASSNVMAGTDGFFTDATEGASLPLWHYDTVDMIWKEEGESVVAQDSGSNSGFSVSGDVSHFSTWNIDAVVPAIPANVVIVIVDLLGLPRDDVTVVSYTTTARIPLEDGPGWHDETSWSNTVQMTPENNEITVLSNNAEREQRLIDSAEKYSGYTTMDIIVENVVLEDIGLLTSAPILVNKRFNDYDGDTTVTIEILVADH